MKKLFAFAFAAMMLAGCVKSPLVGGIYTDVKDGLAVTGNAGSSKVGSSLVPFANKFPKNTKLYKLMTTKPGESA